MYFQAEIMGLLEWQYERLMLVSWQHAFPKRNRFLGKKVNSRVGEVLVYPWKDREDDYCMTVNPRQQSD